MDSIPPTEYCVIDGVSFYSSFTMEKGDSYGAIVQSCASFVTCHYDKATALGDGYDKVHHLSKTTLINEADNINSSSGQFQCGYSVLGEER